MGFAFLSHVVDTIDSNIFEFVLSVLVTSCSETLFVVSFIHCNAMADGKYGEIR